MAGGSGVSPYARSSELVALGLAMRELRELRGVPQRAVTFDAGVGDFYVGAVERARLNPTFAVLMRLLRTLRFSPGELVVRYERNLAVIDQTPKRVFARSRRSSIRWIVRRTSN